VTSSSAAHGGRRYPPCVSLEQGAAMRSSVLRSARAIEVNIEIMRSAPTVIGVRTLLEARCGKLSQYDKYVLTNDKYLLKWCY
jgi:hypothetical protein